MSNPQREAERASQGPFLSVIVPLEANRREELAELLTCLSAQESSDLEVLLAPDFGHGQTCDEARDVAEALPDGMRGTIRIMAPCGDPIGQACLRANGLYASIVPADALVADNWSSQFKKAAAATPGAVVRCRAARQAWTKAKAPMLDEWALFSVGPIEPAYCHDVDPSARGNMQPLPPASWAFPLFAVADPRCASVDRIDFNQVDALFASLCGLCGLTQVEETTVIERTWTDRPVVSASPPAPRGGLRSALPPEVKAALRFALRRIEKPR